MPSRNHTLHGAVPDSSRVALLLVDVISDFEFEDARKLFRNAMPAARAIARLKHWAKGKRIPVIYANDNFGRWQSDFRKLVDRSLSDSRRGAPIARLLAPDDDDYFVLKPKHSAFFSTSLDILLTYLGADTLVLAGFSSNYCVLFTANDAYLRDFRLFAPSDCIAASTAGEAAYARRHLAGALGIDMRPSAKLMRALPSLIGLKAVSRSSRRRSRR